MKDVYFMNRETGELLPSCEAIRDFYKTHNILDDWNDEWQETKIETNTYMKFPDFANVLK